MAHALYLASASPRRRDLLSRLGLPYELCAADVDESPLPGEPPAALAVRLAQTKATTVAARVGDAAVVLAADTVVSLRGVLFGKPVDPEDALRMLTTLAGRQHRVTTAVAIAHGGAVASHVAMSKVWLRRYDLARWRAYVASGDPMDKAGGYAIQNAVARPVQRIVGCRCTAVGLPLAVVADALRAAGHPPPVPLTAACPYGAYDPATCPETTPYRA